MGYLVDVWGTITFGTLVEVEAPDEEQAKALAMAQVQAMPFDTEWRWDYQEMIRAAIQGGLQAEVAEIMEDEDSD